MSEIISALQRQIIELKRDMERLKTNVPAQGGVWKDWTPTFSADGSMTYTSITLTHARYTVVGKTVTFNIKASGTTGGTASNYIAFTPPIVAAKVHAFSGYINDPTTITTLSFLLNTNLILVARYDGANIGLGAGREFLLTGSYEIA